MGQSRLEDNYTCKSKNTVVYAVEKKTLQCKRGVERRNKTTVWADKMCRRKGERPGIRHRIHYHLTDLCIAPGESNGKGHAYWPKPSKKAAFHCLSPFSLLHHQTVSHLVRFLCPAQSISEMRLKKKIKKITADQAVLMQCIQNSIWTGLIKSDLS